MTGPQPESAWDYPRPPAVVPSDERVRVVHAGAVVADSTRALRLLETAHAPAYYVPLADVRRDLLRPSRTRTRCEFKGTAHYVDLLVPGAPAVSDAGWWYPDPTAGYRELADTICFYPQRVDRCEVAGEAVTPLPSAFYGDWPTSRVAPPYKGAPGTEWW